MAKDVDGKSPSLRENLNSTILSRLQRVWLGTKLFRAIFFAGAAAVAGVCQYTTWPTNQPPNTSQVIGISATVVVFLAAALAVFIDQDATNEIAIAQRAVHRAEDLRERLEDTLRVWPNVERMVALHQAISLFRDHIESACVAMVGDESNLLSSMLTLGKRQLPSAAGFSYADQWTICLYRAEQIKGDCRFELKLIEHVRAIDCAKDEARVWPEGRGVAGIAFSNSSEVLIEDLTSEAARAVFKPSGMERTYDDDRYRSMVAIPILVQGNDKPWGMVTATSSNVGHFNHDPEDGLKPVEAMRALSRYAALAVAVVESRRRASQPPPTTTIAKP